MNAALGRAGVVLGLASALLGMLVVGFGLVRRRPQLVRTATIYAVLTLVGGLIAVIAMERALITRDFTVAYVADNGSTRTPALYNFATLWGALEGSIILWAVILAGYTTAVVLRFRRRLEDPLVGWAMVTMLAVCVFFFYMLIGPANPFRTFSPPIGYDGPGPNPLLQNHPLMAFHPPLLYLGYVGFTVPFAFGIGALVTGRLDDSWLVDTRRWTLVAWAALTAGIIAGAWWSYEVLGWGGYWAWDPVENASFLPWLTGTAFLHSAMVQERRAMLRVWNLSLVTATFSLTILGTFITRSGVLESVHAFTESDVGPAILSFFAVVVIASVALIGWRGDRLRAPGTIDSPVSREAIFLATNVAFAAFTFVVLLGTVFPLIVEALNDKRTSVGVPYFNRMTMPVGLALLFLMAVAPVLTWRKTSGELLRERLLVPAWIGVGSIVVAVILGASGTVALIAFGLAGFAGGAAIHKLVQRLQKRGIGGMLGRGGGGMVVHLGVVIISVAFAASQSYVRQAELTLEVGQTASFAGHDLTYLGRNVKFEASRTVSQALVKVDGTGPWAPSLNRFQFGNQVIGTPSVRSTPLSDVSLTLLSLPDGDNEAATIRVTVQPLIMWLWIGGAVMVAGVALALVPAPKKHSSVTHKKRRDRIEVVEPVGGQ